jgi:hypothetical protein
MVVLLSAVFQILIETGTWVWVVPLMWSPAAVNPPGVSGDSVF